MDAGFVLCRRSELDRRRRVLRTVWLWSASRLRLVQTIALTVDQKKRRLFSMGR
jgi:hypothetical protein